MAYDFMSLSGSDSIREPAHDIFSLAASGLAPVDVTGASVVEVEALSRGGGEKLSWKLSSSCSAALPVGLCPVFRSLGGITCRLFSCSGIGEDGGECGGELGDVDTSSVVSVKVEYFRNLHVN